MSIQSVLETNATKIINDIKSGVTLAHVAKEYNCNSGTVWYFLNGRGIVSNRPVKTRGKVIKNKDLIIQMFNDNMSCHSIGKKIELSSNTVTRWLNKWGYDTSGKRKNNPDNLLKDKKDTVLSLFNDGKCIGEISRIVGHSSAAVWHMLDDLGVDTTANHIVYAVDETYFQKIDSEHKAYALGWWYSDGNITDKGKIRVCLQQEDEEIIHWLKSQLKYEGPLYYKPARNTSKPQIELCINRQELAEQLRQLGCVENKSMILVCPSYEQVPKELFHHFIRGYFDGDGSVAKGYINIVSSYDFIYELVNRIPCGYTGIYQRYKDRVPKESSHQLFMCRKEDRVKFTEWVYNSATIFLNRKHDKMMRYGIA